jgi:hypothetical protein
MNMDAIETKTIDHNGQTYRISIYADPDAPNPLKDWCEMGTILSLNRRHVNFDPDGIDAAIESNTDAVPLSFYEHGLCLWSVAGELPVAARCPWDSVCFAGVWLPDAQTLESAKPYGGRTRQRFIRKRARQACEVYTQWCNGDIYGYEIERTQTCKGCGADKPEPLDSCWGFYGLDTCLSEAHAAVQAQMPPAASRVV